MIEKILMKLYLYLEKRLRIPKHVCPVPPMSDNVMELKSEIIDILPQVLSWILEQENISSASGESKRHQVYAKAIKKYPHMRKRDLALAIEIVISKYDI